MPGEQPALDLGEENRVLGATVEVVEVQLKASEQRDAAATRQAGEAQVKLRANPAAPAHSHCQVEIELQRLNARSADDRILLSQAERGRGAAGQEQAAALQRDNVNCQSQLATAQRQLRQLDSLQAFSEDCMEEQAREEQLNVAVDSANSRVRVLEARCAALEAELGHNAAAPRATHQLHQVAIAQAAEAAEMGRSEAQHFPQSSGCSQPQQQREQQRRADSLSLSDLCDMDGLLSQLEGLATSPQRNGGVVTDGVLPSRQHALQQRRGRRQQQQRQELQRQELQRQELQGQEVDWHADEMQIAGEEPSLAAGLEHQLLGQRHQVALLQSQLDTQQQQQRPQQAAGQLPADQQAQLSQQGCLQLLQAQLRKLKRRNTQLQTALADSSLQTARAAAAAHKELVAAQEEAAQLRRQRDEVAARLASLQGLAALAGEVDGDRDGSQRLELLHAELVEYAGRCNAAVEQNAVLLQEKKSWLEKVRAAEAEAQRHRAEAQHLRLQLLNLLPGAAAGVPPGTAQQHYMQQLQQQQAVLVQQLLDGQAVEAALRSVLADAREEQVAACKALASELRRVHALERLRISDVAEQQRLHRRLQEVQGECRQLAQCLVAAQQQAAPPGQGKLGTWAAAQQAGGNDFRIAAFQISAPEAAQSLG